MDHFQAGGFNQRDDFAATGRLDPFEIYWRGAVDHNRTNPASPAFAAEVAERPFVYLAYIALQATFNHRVRHFRVQVSFTNNPFKYLTKIRRQIGSKGENLSEMFDNELLVMRGNGQDRRIGCKPKALLLEPQQSLKNVGATYRH